MTTECYFSQCPHHSTHDDVDEGPFCFEAECKASVSEIRLYESALVLERLGYKVNELARDNPYDKWTRE